MPAELLRLQAGLPATHRAKADNARVAALIAAEKAGRTEAWRTTMQAVLDAVEESIPDTLEDELSGAIGAAPMLVAFGLLTRDLIAPAGYEALIKPWIEAGFSAPE